MPTIDFKGKSNVYSHHLGVPFRDLKIDKAKSQNNKPSLDDNLIIHGDNLHALKALLPRYSSKVKCIYIDPPYNTGNEGWQYNDNVNSPMIKEWLGKTVGNDDLERHDKWLCMMWPRLQLLKELLSDDGVIFISIDDNEQANLKKICDEIFGTENFIGIFIVNSAPNGRDYGHIAKNHEFCLFYARDLNRCTTNLIPDHDKEFSYEDNKGKFNLHPLHNSNEAFHVKNRPNLYYPFYLYKSRPIKSLGEKFYEIGLEEKPGSIKIYPPLSNKNKVQLVWRWEKNKAEQELNQNITGHKTSNNGYRIIQKMRTDKKIIRSIVSGKEFTSRKGTAEVEEILEGKHFLFPKPIQFIKHLIKAGSNKDSIILDSFAGSGTTAHATLALNKEDGGNRKFILIECEDYANKITAERVRRVIKGVPKAKDKNLQKGLSGSFTYCTLDKEISEENLLKGKTLPSYEQLAKYVFYTATGKTIDKITQNKNYFIGKVDKDLGFFVIYKPDKKFLQSNDSALHLDRQMDIIEIMEQKQCKKSIVFATTHYFESDSELKAEGITFARLPFAIHKIVGS